jgi:hypothetical protein
LSDSHQLACTVELRDEIGQSVDAHVQRR